MLKAESRKSRYFSILHPSTVIFSEVHVSSIFEDPPFRIRSVSTDVIPVEVDLFLSDSILEVLIVQ